MSNPKYFVMTECSLSDVSHNLDESLGIINVMASFMQVAVESRFSELSASMGGDQADNLFNGIKVILSQARIAQALVDTAIAGDELEN